jgi:predicted nuclease of predicted toxin-antitoxin system
LILLAYYKPPKIFRIKLQNCAEKNAPNIFTRNINILP